MSIISKLLSTSRRASESLPSRGLNLRSSYANKIVKGETRHRSWRDRISRIRSEDFEAGSALASSESEVESLRQSARNHASFESLFDNKGEPITLFDVDGIEVGTLTRNGVIINGLMIPPSSVEVTDSYEDGVQDLADDNTAVTSTPAEPRVVKTPAPAPRSEPAKPAVANKPEPIIAVPPSDPIGRLDPPISELKDIRNALDGIIKGFKKPPIDLGKEEEDPEEEETPKGVTKDKAKKAKSLAKANSGDDASDLAQLAKAISIVAPPDEQSSEPSSSPSSEPEEPTSSPNPEPTPSQSSEPEPTEDDTDASGAVNDTGAGAAEEPADTASDLQTVKDVLGTVDHKLRVAKTKTEEPTKTTDNPKVKQFVPRKRPPRKVATAMKPIPTNLSKDVATIPDPMGEVKGVALDPQKEMKEIVNSWN